MCGAYRLKLHIPGYAAIQNALWKTAGFPGAFFMYWGRMDTIDFFIRKMGFQSKFLLSYSLVHKIKV